MIERNLKYLVGLVILGAFGTMNSLVLAQEDGADNETADMTEEVIIVTAQRIGEDIQDVPIAVTALTGEALIEQQVIQTSDLQLNTPNMNFTATNFGGSSMSIRGVGQLIISGGSESGVSTHMNEIPLQANLNTYEFFDMERVEILRGPQATLFGRNATGGVVNFITKKPEYSENNFSVDLETGSFSHNRLKGHINAAMGDNFAVRLAGFRLKRDGYTKNLAYGQTNAAGEKLPGIDADLDGRDMFSLRATLRFSLADNFDMWVMGILQEEDSDRARITNQICVRNALPTTGCEPNGVGFEQPHQGATTGGIFGGLAGAIPLGWNGEGDQFYDFHRPNDVDYRNMHTDMDPVFMNEDRTFAWGGNYSFDNYEVSVIGAVTKFDQVNRQDYSMDVGPIFNPTPINPTGYYPVSSPALTAGADWLNSECLLNAGRGGLFGGCMLEGVDTNRMFSYDQSGVHFDNFTIEAKLRSNYDGKFNFQAGINDFEDTRYADYYVLSNSLDIVSRYGAPALGVPPLYPGYFNNTVDPVNGNVRKGTSYFGEIYYDYSPTVKFTAGMRLNDDFTSANNTSVLFNALNHHGVIVGLHQSLLEATAAALGIPVEFVPLDAAVGAMIQQGLLHPLYLQNTGIGGAPFWSRTLNLLLGPFATAEPELELLRLYGATDTQINRALLTGAYSPERIALSRMVPIVPQFNESRLLTGSPTSFQFEEISYRFGMDYQWSEDVLFYGHINKGYKPGGLNPAIPIDFADRSLATFDSEGILAFEGGVKSTLMDGKLTSNFSAFYYNYSGLQTTRILNNSALTDNIDAFIAGLEAEGKYRLTDAIGIDFAYGYLNTRVGDSTSLDPTNRAGGQDGWVLLNNIDFGALTATNYLAREIHLTDAVVNGALQAGAALDIRNGTTISSVSYPANANGVSIPAYMSRNYLIALGVEVSDGIPINLEDNQLPNSPEHSFKIGVSYGTPINIYSGFITYRLDMFWQSDSFAREFNTVGDKIEAWGQLNASINYESDSTGVGVSIWARNLLDKDNVTGHYLTSDTSGFYRNYFLTEPRIMGASIRFNFD